MGRSAEDVDAILLQAEREIERSLTAELGDGAPAFLPLVDVQHVLEGKRLEEELVAGVVVGGDGFRIRIHHEGLETVFFQREGGMNAAIIKFNPLPDPVRTTAKNHHLAFVGILARFIVTSVVGRVIIGRVGLEFRCARIHQAVAGHEPEFLSFDANFVFGAPRQMGNLAIRKA